LTTRAKFYLAQPQ